MIPADALYTNQLCRIAWLFNNRVEIKFTRRRKGKRFVARLCGKEFEFRRDGNNFLFLNPYGEKAITENALAVLKIIILKALQDAGEYTRDVLINGERVELKVSHFAHLASLFYTGKWVEDMLDVDRMMTSRSTCSKCPFRSKCQMEPTGTSPADVKEHRYQEIFISPAAVARDRGEPLEDVAVELFTYYICEDTSKVDERMREVERRLVGEMGYSKAHFLLNLFMDSVLYSSTLLDTTLELDDFKGYLVGEKDRVYPSDKMWELFYGYPFQGGFSKILKEVKKDE